MEVRWTPEAFDQMGRIVQLNVEDQIRAGKVDAAHDHVAETRAVRPATGAALLERHARQKLYVVVGFLDVEPLELLGSDRDDAQRDILQILGARLNGLRRLGTARLLPRFDLGVERGAQSGERALRGRRLSRHLRFL